ncbi:thioesterase family protein [Pyramidobacter piscolens]|uniref:acyl-[acyl-carrier-protein] thioesterase n=1 Tax=Pyramidobacter piscolens TaxID=638849 RepID=UPI0028E7C312|nr:thioesterase family protein [Pyramidobacter piscolens]
MDLMFTKKFAVPQSEVTPCRALKPFHLLNMLQDAADGAVDAMNPPPEYWNCGCAWMLHQYSIRLDRPLTSGDAGTINTGHMPLRDLYSVRRFRLLDGQGKQTGLADSMWIFVDLASRRPVRLSRHLPEVFMEKVEETPFEPIFAAPKRLERADRSVRLHVRLGELDANGHVNNAYYLSWAAEAVPREVYMSCGLVEADILYKHEAVYGMDLTVTTQQDGLDFRHEIRSDGGELIAQFSTRWAEVGSARP